MFPAIPSKMDLINSVSLIMILSVNESRNETPRTNNDDFNDFFVISDAFFGEKNNARSLDNAYEKRGVAIPFPKQKNNPRTRKIFLLTYFQLKYFFRKLNFFEIFEWFIFEESKVRILVVFLRFSTITFAEFNKTADFICGLLLKEDSTKELFDSFLEEISSFF
ncbi:unnamed protein product [Pneumocystis jirovecii]|uniref:Uncharacterized protein n=1 Tax=Pneumocystis jirovecii TaxID=42068 RepID=L0PD61_PNEJI|nr:unnamed protein product [Pneumocystis jirovecii]